MPERSVGHPEAALEPRRRGPAGRAIVTCAAATLLLLTLGWPAQAALAQSTGAGCGAGLPPDLAAQLQPLLVALGDATGQLPDCGGNGDGGTSSGGTGSVTQRDLQLIAETLALLSLASEPYDPYASSGLPPSSPSRVVANAPPAARVVPAAARAAAAASGQPGVAAGTHRRVPRTRFRLASRG